jgi:sulfur-oxidizing protein SoxY
MQRDATLKVFDRRTFLIGAGAAAAFAALIDSASAAAPEASAEYKAALQALLGQAHPQAAGLTLDLPENVENGEHVPVALSVDSPMTAGSHVKAIHLLSTANPRANVATFRFTLLSGKAQVTSRMRLAKSQEVVAVAELSDGTLLMTSRFVEVKIGGCGI